MPKTVFLQFSSICKLIIIKIYVMKYFKPNAIFYARFDNVRNINSKFFIKGV